MIFVTKIYYWFFFAVAVSFGLGLIRKPSRGDIAIYFLAMVLLLAIGVIGFVLHIQFDLTTQNAIVPERFLRGAPFLAPMLFANMGLVGLIMLMNPVEAEWLPRAEREKLMAEYAA